MHVYRLNCVDYEGCEHIDVVSHRKLTQKMLEFKFYSALLHAAVDMSAYTRGSAMYEDLFKMLQRNPTYLVAQELTPISAEKAASVWGWQHSNSPTTPHNDDDVTNALSKELDRRGIVIGEGKPKA